MKKAVLQVVMILSMLFLASTCWCLTINDGSNTYVGTWDTFFAGTDDLGGNGNESSEALELAWVQNVTGDGTLAYTQYDDGFGDISIYDVTGYVGDGYAFALNDEPDYILIKWGNGGNTDDDDTEYVAWTLWTNFAESDWAVISLSDSGLAAAGYEIKNIEAFSHYGETAPVPEPATLLLMGLGLLGFAGATKKIKK